MRCFTPQELLAMIPRLTTLRGYFDIGGECRETIDKTIEIAYGLHDLWVREGQERTRRKGSADGRAYRRRITQPPPQTAV
jgi:hypothetical protein